jgi:Leucine-rich repeat (LRR) protein
MFITTSWSLEELRSVVGNTITMSSLKQLKQQVRALQIADLCQSVTLSSDIDLSALAFGMEAVGLSDSAKYATTTTATAEQLAVQWLIEHSDPFVLSESNTPAHTEFRTIQRYALLTLWFAQFAKRNCNNHSDHNNWHKRQQYWYNTTNWVVAVDECDWHGVGCTLVKINDDIGESELMVVTSLQLESNNVHGSLPPDIGLLSYLESVELGYNQLTGSLPESIGLWTDLQRFAVSANRLTGTLPESMSTWSNVESFDCYANGLTGPLPSVLYQSNAWPNVTHFVVGVNSISGPLPDVSPWTRLGALHVGSTRLSGTIPQELQNVVDTLEILSVGFSNVHGPLPSWLGRLTQLRYLDIGGMGLEGPFPAWIQQLPRLELLDASFNDLDGMLPESMGIWSRRLDTLYLAGNRLSGAIPTGIGQLTRLESIEFHENLFSGTIPESVGQLTNMVFFYVDSNALTGTIPESIEQWIRIKEVGFEMNQLVGSVPHGLCDISSLEGLAADCLSQLTCDCCTVCYWNTAKQRIKEVGIAPSIQCRDS